MKSVDSAAAAPSPSDVCLGEWMGSAAPAYCRDLAGRLVSANPAFARKFRRSAGELTGVEVTSFVHPDDLPAFTSGAARQGAPSPEGARTHRWMTLQGWRWYTWEETPLGDADGTVTAVR